MRPSLTDVLSEAPLQIFLGAVEFKNVEFTRVRPLAMAGPESWQRLPHDVFRDDELVFTRDRAVVGREKDYVVLFTIAPNTNPQNRYITADISPPIPVVDLKYFSDERRREVVTIDGLDLPPVGHEQFVFLLGNGKCVFPRMDFNHDDQRWIVAGTEDLDSLDVYDTDLDQPSKLYGLGGVHYALPGHAPYESTEIINWQSDADCLGAALKFLRRHGDAPNGADAGPFTQRAIERLQTAIARGDLSSTGQAKNLALLRRLPAIVDKLKSGLATETDLEQVAAEMLSAPPVVERLEAMIGAEKSARMAALEESIRSEARDRMEAELSELSARNSSLMAEIEEWVREEERLKDEVKRLSELRESKLEDIRQFLSSVTGKVAEGALELAKLVDVAKEVGFEFPSRSQREVAVFSSLPPWTERSGSDAPMVCVADLPEILKAAASNAGLPLYTMASLDVALRAGTLPALHGPDVDYLLDVYAACVTGGQRFRMALDPSALGPDDLWRHPATGQETALGATWRAALADPGRVFLFCIDNADSATLSNWQAPFHALFRRHRPPNLLVALIERDEAGSTSSRVQFSVRIPTGPFHGAGVFAIQRESSCPIAKRIVTMPLLSALGEADREEALAAFNEFKQLGVESAKLWLDLYAASQAWFALDDNLRNLARVLYLETRTQNGDGHA